MLWLLMFHSQESVFSEREREWNGQQTELSGQLERVRGELEESQSQCLLLREASDKVQWTRHTNTERALVLNLHVLHM